MESLESLVRRRMDCSSTIFDASHDYLHVFRVRNTAKSLLAYDKEPNSRLVEVSALLHDLNDHKYDNPMPLEEDKEVLDVLSQIGLNDEERNLVIKIVDNVSHSKEQKLRAEGSWTHWHDTCKELHYVQDADRLDAIGGIGMLRAAAYSGAKGRPLVVPSDKGQYDTAVSHAYQKLLKLSLSLKTPRAIELAVSRTNTMNLILQCVDKEVNESDIL